MDERSLYLLEEAVLETLESKLTTLETKEELHAQVERIARSINPSVTADDIALITTEINSFKPVNEYLFDENVEDIMINNTNNIFLYKTDSGAGKAHEKIMNRKELETFVKKLKMYATTDTANNNIFDVHLPNGSRANIVQSPIGADITIRNYRTHALSIIDLINKGELSYNLAGRLWLYSEGMGTRPANLLIGGLPAAGKTTLMNAMFSFFRPEERIVVIEETYELNTETQENCVRLETSPSLSTRELVQNTLRMRPDRIIIGEVRGEEAKDMMTSMNIGRISMSTIHASTTREVITRLEHTPMNIERDVIPLIDAIVIITQTRDDGVMSRKISQVSEISGIETQVLLSDLYTYNYKTHKGSDIFPSVTYRDLLSRISGIPPNEIVAEEQKRGRILEKLNELGKRDLKSINQFCRDYYDSPEAAARRIGVQ